MIVGTLVTLGIALALGFLAPSLRVAVIAGLAHWAIWLTFFVVVVLDGMHAEDVILSSIPVGLTVRLVPTLIGYTIRTRLYPPATPNGYST